MKMRIWRERQFAFVLLLLCAIGAGLPGSASALVEPLFDLNSVTSAPFPSDRYTELDSRYLTGLRVNMPKTNCTARPTDCSDVDVLNTLDGFNPQPRFRIPFSGPIALSTVSSSTIFFVRLGDVTRSEVNPREIIGINNIQWDPTTRTLSFEPDKLLDQHTRYLMVVTDGVRDTVGFQLWDDDFWDFVTDLTFYRYGCCELSAYRLSLINALEAANISPFNISVASVFTTMSATAELEKMRDQVKAGTPAAANFNLATDGSRTFFPLSTIQSMAATRWTSSTTAPATPAEQMPMPVLGIAGPVVGSVSFGRYSSPDYTTAQGYIPATFTRTGSPVVQRTNNIQFMLIEPAGTKPAGGWPVAIYGHGFGSNRETIMAFAAVLASKGIATIGIAVVGHGGGPQSTMTITRTNSTSVTLPLGARSIDQNGDGAVGSFEGVSAMAPRALLQFRDGMRQTVVDLMQLVRVIETNGVDANGDGTTDLNPSRIYFYGISFGAMYGPMLLAVDPSVRAGLPMVGGGTVVDIERLGLFRTILAAPAVANRTPSLLNAPGSPGGFNENKPLRNMGVMTNNVAGAMELQDFFDRAEWAQTTGDPMAYAPHMSAEPLAGVPAKSVLMLIAKGDQTVPNPTNSAMIRAAGLENRTTYFRYDLVYQSLVGANPTLTKNPHPFAGLLGTVLQPYALQAQTQMATFFQSDGATIIDPDGSGTNFEAPIIGPLPDTLNFIP